MKLLKSGMLALLIISVFSSAGISQDRRAQKRVVDYYFNGGASLQRNPDEFKDNYYTGLNVGLGMGYEFSTEWLLRGYIEYNRHVLDVNKFKNSYSNLADGKGTLTGGTSDLYSFFFSLVSRIRTEKKKLDPYMLFGGGIVQQAVQDMHITMPHPDSEYPGELPDSSYTLLSPLNISIALQIGVGMDFQFTEHLLAFIEANYCYVFTSIEKTRYIPLKAGIKLRY